uniref:Terpene synthase n=1 Tax=Phyllotreta striolata TaxID=444603 RepID=A0A140AZ72_PHYSR|nr:terpene synthase [Phyllotreta striolata]
MFAICKVVNYYSSCRIIPKVSGNFGTLLQRSFNRAFSCEIEANEPFVDLFSEEEHLKSMLPAVKEEIIEEHLVLHKDNKEIRNRCEKLIDYNINTESKFLTFPLIFLRTYKLLEKPALLNDENLKKACILAWCHRLIHASVIISDDIVDDSEMRYNKTTWCKLPDVGKEDAITDAAFLLTGAIFLLQNHLRHHPHNFILQKHFLRGYAFINVSYMMDNRKHHINELEKYQVHTKLYFSNLFSTAMYLANVENDYWQKVSDEICNDISQYLKVEDDVIDLYDSKGKIRKCTDISLGRPSWFLMEAYKRANAGQRKILEENFHKNNEESVEKLYSIFQELELLEVYRKFTDNFYAQEISKIREKIPKSIMQDILINLVNLAVNHKLRY